jgi:hypothetical protein
MKTAGLPSYCYYPLRIQRNHFSVYPYLNTFIAGSSNLAGGEFVKFFPAIKGINLTDECGPGEPPLPARSVPRGRGRAADFYTMAREDAVLP